jgi:hypothetical protein
MIYQTLFPSYVFLANFVIELAPSVGMIAEKGLRQVILGELMALNTNISINIMN